MALQALMIVTLRPFNYYWSCILFSRLSPPNSGINGSGPRRKQARPRRRSGDSVGNSSLDLSKSDSPINAGTPYSAHHGKPGSSPTSSAGSSQHNQHSSHLHDDATPENLSMKRPSSSPAINLVRNTIKITILPVMKTEKLKNHLIHISIFVGQNRNIAWATR